MALLLIKILNKLKILGLFNINIRIGINRQSFIIPILKGVGLANVFMTEPWMINVLKSILPTNEKALFVDVGSNIGQTLIKVRSISRTCRYMAFEPNPHCIDYLKKLSKLNNFSDVQLYNQAISSKTGNVNLNLYSIESTDESASIVEGFRPGENVVSTSSVQAINPTDMEADLFDELSVIKIDVEGAELDVLQAFFEIIQKNQAIILMEILPVYHEGNMIRLERQKKILMLMKTLEYHCFRIVTKNVNSVEYLPVREIGIHADVHACDYIFLPTKKLHLLEK